MTWPWCSSLYGGGGEGLKNGDRTFDLGGPAAVFKDLEGRGTDSINPQNWAYCKRDSRVIESISFRIRYNTRKRPCRTGGQDLYLRGPVPVSAGAKEDPPCLTQQHSRIPGRTA